MSGSSTGSGGGAAALRAAASAGDVAACSRYLGTARCVRFSRDEAGRSALHLAASAGHGAVVRLLLNVAAPKEVDSPDGAGCTALQRAAADGHEEVLRLLLARGGDVDKQDSVVLLYLIANVAATKMGGAACPKDPHRPPVFPQLSSMKPSRPSDRYAPTASRHAANLICERLISRDLSPDRGHFSIGETQPNRKNGKLMRLIALRSRPVTNSYKLQSLIRGYLYNSQDRYIARSCDFYGRDINIAAATEKSHGMGGGRNEFWMWNSWDRYRRDFSSWIVPRSGLMVEWKMSRSDYITKVLYLRDFLLQHGNSALHEAAWKGYSRSVRLLAAAGANLSRANAGGFTALHLCCQNGHNQSCRELLLSGCDPDIQNNYGDTSLHTAARYGHAGVTRILISAQCRVSEQNKNGDTALHIAAAMGRRKLTRILLEAGCDKSVRNKQNETARDIALRKDLNEILTILDECVAKKEKKTKSKKRSKSKVRFDPKHNADVAKVEKPRHWSPYGNP
ncbi:hypothetical protein GEV33_001328 [Tenebrio molitor]|uniref:Uncharacterized protein n=1 Tax=Tenebrio molitor TaxID=7067 RepID=A0A8J6HXT9_TENMO|nr:hypothetical protein GEV33_001328 [Tenebrio molitor]